MSKSPVWLFMILVWGVAGFAAAQEVERDRTETRKDSKADDDTTAVVIESEITVTSTIPELFTGREISKRRIDEAGDEDLAEFFRQASGTSAIRRGPINLEPTVHGLQEEQVGMFVDGTRTFAAGPARMDSNISHVHPGSVRNLRVIKGPYALTWGAGTLSAIEVETFTPPLGTDRTGFEFDAEYGENAEASDLFANVWQSRERWSWSLLGGFRSGDDYEDGNGNLVPADYDSVNVRGSLSGQLGDSVLFTYKGAYQEQSDLDYPGRLLDATYFFHRAHAVDFTWTGSGKVSEAYGQLYVNRKDHRMNNDEKPTGQPAPGRVPPFALDIDLPTESNTSGGRFRVGLGDSRRELNLGVDYYTVEQSATRSIARRDNGVVLFTDVVWPDAEIEDLGAYAQLTVHRDRVRFGASVRLDSVDAAAGEVSQFYRDNVVGDTDQSETHVSAAVNAVVDTGSNWTVHVGLGRAVRTATVSERYSDRFPATKFQLAAEFMGNPLLNPEESLELNLGASGRFGELSIEIDGFYREIDDYITVRADASLPKRLPLSPPTVFRYVNGEGANFYGGDFLVRQRVNERFSWRGSLSFVRAEDEEFDEPALGIAPLGGELGLRVHPLVDRLWIDLSARFADRQDRVATNRFEQETPGYTTFDLAAQYHIGKTWTLRVAAENLTDKAYAHHLNSPNPFSRQRILEIGRNVRIGLRYRFGAKP